jgi:galactokinase/mevalonate kinase-like predicted kinase
MNWHYLIVTASHDSQARGYRGQLELRRKLGLLPDIDNVLVVPDPGGKRVGSGGSTLFCLLEVINRQLAAAGPGADWKSLLKGLRILIVHAGGDSQRLPAYGPCGKIFVPVPGESDSGLPVTLFDRQLPIYLALPAPSPDKGQVVVTAGDVLLQFSPADVRLATDGFTGLGCLASPEDASHHGVFCSDASHSVRNFLQKPSVAEQRRHGAIDPYGQSVLDIGIVNFDPATAARLLELFGICKDHQGTMSLSGGLYDSMMRCGLDFYREISCALGTETNFAHYTASVTQSGSKMDTADLKSLFNSLSGMPFHVNALSRCDFLHFGTSHQIVSSGLAIIQQERGAAPVHTVLDINNDITASGNINGTIAWVEGCHISSTLELAGQNIVVGTDITDPLSLPHGACLDCIAGRDRNGKPAWFIRCYGITDTFKDMAAAATFCNVKFSDWLAAAGIRSEDLWDASIPADSRRLWNARVFPAATDNELFRDCLWVFAPQTATLQQRKRWLASDRYSAEEISELTDQQAFFDRRNLIRGSIVKGLLRRMFHPQSRFSASELAFVLSGVSDKTPWVAALFDEARRYHESAAVHSADSLVFPRIIHSIADTVQSLKAGDSCIFDGLDAALTPATRDWLASCGLSVSGGIPVEAWSAKARELAFASLGRTILSIEDSLPPTPKNALRSDEIVWGRAPARLDTGGGWTDTPPYSLEFGGCVVNTAVNLNGQPPIQAYARIIDEPVIRLASIDLGLRIQIDDLPQLLDYRHADSGFGLAKAAISLCGFAPDAAGWPKGVTLREMMGSFGGGVEVTTLAAIPKGSGLGTSSIMGAVLVAVISRVMGRTLAPRQLFNEVLRLEQALTTGGGWQDQVGGVAPGAKIVSTNPGIIPDPRIHYLPSFVIDPAANGSLTLLYYTGITRLAKNILHQVVGRYLSRDRRAMATLRRIHDLAPIVADTFSTKDVVTFGKMIDTAWQLNKQLDPNSTNDEVEMLLSCIRPHIIGAKLLGAGGGGFLLMVCKSKRDAEAVRELLTKNPPNPRARFFDYDVNPDGLVVTVS